MADSTTAPDVNSTPAFPVKITGGIPWISFDAQVEDKREAIARHFDLVDYAEATVYPENRKRYEIVYYSRHRNGMADQQRIWFMNKKDHRAWKEMVEDIITLAKEASEEANDYKSWRQWMEYAEELAGKIVPRWGFFVPFDIREMYMDVKAAFEVHADVARKDKPQPAHNAAKDKSVADAAQAEQPKLATGKLKAATAQIEKGGDNRKTASTDSSKSNANRYPRPTVQDKGRFLEESAMNAIRSLRKARQAAKNDPKKQAAMLGMIEHWEDDLKKGYYADEDERKGQEKQVTEFKFMRGDIDEAEFKRVMKEYWRYKFARHSEKYDDAAEESDVVSEEYDYSKSWRESMEEPTCIHEQLAHAFMVGNTKAEGSPTAKK